MFKLFGLSLLIVAANAFPSDEQVGSVKLRIVGGKQASIKTLPYQAQLLQREKHICGGTIISERWILSAAHCVEFLTADCLIITGSDRVSKGGKRRRITNVIVHPAYDTETNDNDIALIQLEKKIKFDEDQKPIELAERVPRTGEIMTISGFGKKGENAEYATSLEVTTVPVVDYETCRMKYVEDPITENMFCAGNGSADACEGDSGGPAVIDEVLVGVISAGMKCSDTFYPGIYTRVANYRQWINDTVNGQLPKHPNVPASHSEYRPIHVIVTLLCKVFNTIVQFFG